MMLVGSVPQRAVRASGKLTTAGGDEKEGPRLAVVVRLPSNCRQQRPRVQAHRLSGARNKTLQHGNERIKSAFGSYGT
jgi:hypothetical protein